MIKKIVYVGMVITILIAMLSGCALISDDSKDNDNPDNVTESDSVSKNDLEQEVQEEKALKKSDYLNSGITVNSIPFSLIATGRLNGSSLDKDIQIEIEMLKYQKGYSYWKINEGEYLIFITSGEKNTGGYTIEVKSVEDNEAKTVILVEESSPAKDAVVTEAFTYPFAVIKVKGITENFTIVNQKSEEFSLINLESGIIHEADTNSGAGTMLSSDESKVDFTKPVRGIYQGQIDGNSIEVKILDDYYAFRTQEVQNQIDGLETGDIVEVVVEISPYDQLIAKKIKKVVD